MANSKAEFLFDFFYNPEVTEILMNGPTEIWLEKCGQLKKSTHVWPNATDYLQFVRSMLDLLNSDLSLQEPFCSGHAKGFRIQVVGPPVTALPILSFRRILPRTMALTNWKTKENAQNILKEFIQKKRNLIIFGATGSGKTTLLSSLLGEVEKNERVILLEDIEELKLPNPSSIRLLTRTDTMGLMKDISLSDLIKHSLRLRPDRLALGEVRGPEAKDLLLALATGHKGSFGTLHAHSLNEALLRLEMLIQLGAPQWQTKSIRQLILLSVDAVIGVQKGSNGDREISGIHKLTGLEDFGFLTEEIV